MRFKPGKFNMHLNDLQLESCIAAATGRRDAAPAEYEGHLAHCEQCFERFLKMATQVKDACVKTQQILPFLDKLTSPITDEERLAATRHLSLCGVCWKQYEETKTLDDEIFKGVKL